MEKKMRLVPMDEPASWNVVDAAGTAHGTVKKLATGHLVTEAASGRKVKRFRQIDALHEVFGEDVSFEGVER
jgi:hypothetical protein